MTVGFEEDVVVFDDDEFEEEVVVFGGTSWLCGQVTVKDDVMALIVHSKDTFVTDESGAKRRIRLENNIVRWRTVRNPDGTTSRESNARFVRWSDGSLQLLIGNEVLDISVQDAQHDQAHLFRRHGKVNYDILIGILQSQGRLLRKMRFMPSSLSSNSHRQLTALVDSRHKKVYKVKNCITDIDPEREKEEKEKAESQTIRAILHH
ncbi:hypothetical protein RIF29_35459 [Crotalaria pallida]|uniref:Uncharacterized protein n=1 Tax=Crotalaria pallida TaxID=3830 RepID=A0AAN9E9Y9_CROPI